MLNSLFKVRINWYLYIVVAILIMLVFPYLSIWSYIAILITLHQFMLLFYSIGYVIPIRYLFGSLMCLQFLLGPTLTYNIEITKIQMVVPQEQYFSYVIPAIISFIFGLHLFAGNLEGEVLNKGKIMTYIEDNKNLSLYLVGVGFLSSYLTGVVSADLSFVFYLLSGLKFIGVFMIIIGSQKLKVALLILVYSSIVVSSLNAKKFEGIIDTENDFRGKEELISFLKNL